MQAAGGVQHAHNKKVLHRDLKPANLLLHQYPEHDHLDVLVSDFGIAIKAHSESSLPMGTTQLPIGTPAYMAPEQFIAEAVPASDQFALGIIAYELLTGKRPYVGADRKQLPPSFNDALKQTGNEKLMGIILECLEEVVVKALAKNPQERYPSVGDFAQMFKEAHVKGVEEEEKQRRAFEAAKIVIVEDLMKSGEELSRQKNHEEALQAYEQAIQINPSNYLAFLKKAYSLNYLWRNKEALAAFDEAINLNPNFSEAYVEKSFTLTRLRR